MYRSWMFVPGSDERKLKKAPTLAADALIYDLEDSVFASEKGLARQRIKDALLKGCRDKNFVRINSVSSPFFAEDITSFVAQEIYGLVVPKVETTENILHVAAMMDSLEEQKGLARGAIKIIPLIESALGVYNAYSIACSSKRVQRILFGSADFCLDINTKPTKSGIELLYARSQLVISSRAAQIEAPIDSVFFDLTDSEGLFCESAQAKQLGFSGKLVVHPSQINVVHEAFSPTLEEIETAQKLIAAYTSAELKGIGAIEFQGHMVDYPIVERARKLLQSTMQGNI